MVSIRSDDGRIASSSAKDINDTGNLDKKRIVEFQIDMDSHWDSMFLMRIRNILSD